MKGPGAFSLMDVTTGEMSWTNQSDLVVAQWGPAWFTSPSASLLIYVEGENLGHRLTLHGRVPGDSGIEFQQSLLPTVDPWLVNYPDAASDGGYWTYDQNWNWVFIPFGSVCISGTMGLGMEYWVTRDDTPEAVVSGNVFEPSSYSYPFWVIVGSLPPAPPHWQPVSFRIPNLSGNFMAPGRLTVHDSSGGIHAVEVTGTDYLWSYDYYGALDGNTLSFANAIATVDDLYDWWLVDELTQQTYPVRTSDFLGDWHPTFATPNNGALRLSIFGERQNHTLKLMDGEARPIPTYDSPQTVFGAGGPYLIGTVEYHTLQGMNQQGELTYSIPFFTVDVVAPRGDYWIVDETTGEESPHQTADLSVWFPPPTPMALDLSTSRWNHDLWLVQANGRLVPVEKHVTEGDISFDSHGRAWFNSYYSFSASASYHPFLDWWLEDRDTGEATAANPSSGELLNWIALADPKNLAATENNDGTFALTWSFAETSTEGAFKIERRIPGAQPWRITDTIAAAAVLDTATHTARIPSLASPSGAAIRVYYEYGGRRSTASNTITVQHADANFDFDHDGLPDWWETAHGLNPYDGDDALLDFDGDGKSNLEEFEAGTDPNDYYDGHRPPGIPAAPSQVREVRNADGSRDIFWQSNSDNETYFVIRDHYPDGRTVELGRVGPGQTRLHIPAPMP